MGEQLDFVQKSSMAAQHSSESPEWYTRESTIEDVRYVLGGIDFDPASCARAQKRVRAGRWIGSAENALAEKTSWGKPGEKLRALVNVPSARGLPPAHAWWSRLGHEVAEEVIGSFVWVAFNCMQVESLIEVSEKAGILRPSDCYICMPREREQFERPTLQMGFDGEPVLEMPKNPPNWAWFICYSWDRGVKIRFKKTFGKRGEILTGF